LVDQILEFYGCDPSQLENVNSMMRILVRAAELAGMKVVGVKPHKFNPHGFTGVVLLAESHIAIHTYPEDEYAIIDILACNPKDLPRGCRYLKRSISHIEVESEARIIRRLFVDHESVGRSKLQHSKLSMSKGLINYLVDVEVLDSFQKVNAELALKIAKQKILKRLGKFSIPMSLVPMAAYPLAGAGFRVPVKIEVEHPCFRLLCSKLAGIPVHVLSAKSGKTGHESVRRVKSVPGGKKPGRNR